MFSPQVVANDGEAKNLASRIKDPARLRPIVVVTVASGHEAPWINADSIAQQAGDVVDVYVITTIDASWAFAGDMPEGGQVYGGAGRIYPAGSRDLANKSVSPLRMASSAKDGQRLTQQLLSDALSMAFASGQFATKVDTDVISVTGEIKGFAAVQAIVDLGSGKYGNISPELVVPGFSAEALFKKRQSITGDFDRQTRRIDVSGLVLGKTEALSGYDFEDVISTLVKDVDADSVRLTLYPQTHEPEVTVTVSRELVTGNPLDDLRDLMAPGDVVSARIYGLEPNWALLLNDIDDDEDVVVAPPIIKGGPPWLSPPVPEIVSPARHQPQAKHIPIPEADSELVEELPRQGRKLTHQLLLSIDSKNHEVADLRDQVMSLGSLLEHAENDRANLRAELQVANRDVNVLSTDLTRLRSQLRKAKTVTTSPREMPEFADSELAFRYLVTTQWALRIQVGEQRSMPLHDYTIGPEFLESLRRLQGITPEKVADVVVEIVTGLALTIDSRDLHVLREGHGPSEKAVTRADGATCWRASLQVGTPAARRLHYWVLTGGGIELSRVTVHDDFKP